MPGVCGFTHQPTTPPASLATPHDAVRVVGPHDDRRNTRDRPVLDLVLQVLRDLLLVVQAALLEPEPGDVDQACRVGRLPAAHRADERALNIERVGADGLGEDVLRQHLAFLQQVRVLLGRVVVAGHVTRSRLRRCAFDGRGAASQQREHRQGGDHARACPTTTGAAHLAFTIDWRVNSLATSHGSGNGCWEKLIDHSMKSSWNWMPTSHRLLPIVGSSPMAMNPL